jgi:hypothetical protein
MLLKKLDIRFHTFIIVSEHWFATQKALTAKLKAPESLFWKTRYSFHTVMSEKWIFFFIYIRKLTVVILRTERVLTAGA